ncbi:hypothetical protein EAH_00007230, partial [Eimeria acervulina]
LQVYAQLKSSPSPRLAAAD